MGLLDAASRSPLRVKTPLVNTPNRLTAGRSVALPPRLTILMTIVMATSVHLPKSLLEAVDRKAHALRVSRNQLVIRALQYDLQGNAGWSPGFFDRLSDINKETADDVEDLLQTIQKARRSKPARRF